MTRYGFRQAVGGLFLAGEGALRTRLPEGLWPLQAMPGFGVLAITAFDFVESEVGPYTELVFSVLVPPWAPSDEDLPDAAYYPFFLATNTEAARAHAAERWRLPAHDRCLGIKFERDGDRRCVHVSDGPTPALQLTVDTLGGSPQTRRYLCFSAAGSTLYRVAIDIRGSLDEHEEESGLLELFEHAVADEVSGMIEDDVPFREQYMDQGEQRFADLTVHRSDGK